MSDLSRKIVECAAKGLSQSETAKSLGCSASYICQVALRHDLHFKSTKRGRKETGVRGEVMANLYRAGLSLQQIGDQYDVSRERVRQIITKYHGLTALDGGIHVAARQRAEKRARKLDAGSCRKWGCTFDQYRELLRIGKQMRAKGCGPHQTPTAAYSSQRASAALRGIEWDISLWEWWTIWQQSGYWEKRGRGNGYVMCRRGVIGPYSVDNVFIGNARENISNRRNRKTDLPIGVQKSPTKGKFIASRRVNGKYQWLGTFSTPQLAHAAYLASWESE